MVRTFLFVLFSLSCVLDFLVGNAFAQKWADLTMTVVLDGPVPERKPVAAPLAGNCLLPNRLTDDLIIAPDTKAIANLVFMIDTKKTPLEELQIHPDLEFVSDEMPVLDTVSCMFEPHVLAVRAGQTIEVKNSGREGHNVKFSFFENRALNPLVRAGGSVFVPTKVGERAATKVECAIHPWMSAFVFVLDHPYIGISDANGKIKIEKLPADVDLNFRVWHESQNKSIENVILDGKIAKWSRGCVKLRLNEGSNDLGTLLLKPNCFKVR